MDAVKEDIRLKIILPLEQPELFKFSSNIASAKMAVEMKPADIGKVLPGSAAERAGRRTNSPGAPPASVRPGACGCLPPDGAGNRGVSPRGE